MIEVRVDKNGGIGGSYVKMSGDMKQICSETFTAIEAVHEAIAKKDREDADLFKMLFYKAANAKKFFNWDTPVCDVVDHDEYELKKGLMENGASEDTADELVKLAKQLNDLLHKAVREACDD